MNHVLDQPKLADKPRRTILIQWEPRVVRGKDWGRYRNPESLPFAAVWTISKNHCPLDWYLGATYAELKKIQFAKILGRVSACQTTKTRHPGHKLRDVFVRRWLSSLEFFDLYGWQQPLRCYRARPPSRRKEESLFPYPYHFCAENSREPHYFTEKIADAFLAECLPLYWGCPDIERWFPQESVIWVPLEEPDRAREIVQQAVADDERRKRLSAIREAKRRVLDQHQIWAILERIIAGL